jgi:NAD(P)-dependent dehydrogenase (short-subunit alcohol dehydrogenase family)
MDSKRVIVVTGALRGLGRSLLAESIARGHSAVGIARRPVSGAAPDLPEGASLQEADLRDTDAFTSALERILATHGRIDVLFNNAAVYPAENLLSEPLDSFLETFQVNVHAVAAASRTVLPTMIRQGYGRIFNLGSWAHLSPIGNSAAYSASKGALHALTKAISRDLEAVRGDSDVQIHEWIPGHLNTAMGRYAGLDTAVVAKWGLALATSSPSDRSRIYEQDREWSPPRSRLGRLRDRLMGSR